MAIELEAIARSETNDVFILVKAKRELVRESVCCLVMPGGVNE